MLLISSTMFWGSLHASVTYLDPYQCPCQNSCSRVNVLGVAAARNNVTLGVGELDIRESKSFSD